MPKRLSKYYFDLEKKILKSLGLKCCKGSGNTWLEKEDGYNNKVLVQLKTTESKNIIITYNDWLKLQYHAKMCGKIPIFINYLIDKDELFITFNFSDKQINNISDDVLALFETDDEE